MSDSTNDNTKSTAEKTESDAATPKVHSANSWEKADLGDADRKSKFLRLMGASKKEHQGRFVIGDQDTATARDKHDVTRMSSQLEEQYEQGMEHRRIGGRRGHVGLGFHDEEKKEQETEESTKEEKTEEKDEETGEKEQSKPEECEKRKQSDDSEETKNDNENESPAKKMKMNFVKSSS
ncbi:small acidic protein-like [Haliotis rufescens]|uniref:small acidic protein-like n=1 Tax=Haliotis rufescens TaxID=6454 RepID=UPI00201EAD45|nr:small acidic protein-like [Haliotis rufescens]